MPERLVVTDLSKLLLEYEAGTLTGYRKSHLVRYLYARSLLSSFPGLILDIACGSGYGSKLLAEAGHTVTGMDISSEAIKLATTHNSHPEVTFEVQDITTYLSPEDALFSGVVCFETLEHLESGQEHILHDLKDATQKGSPVIFSIPLNHPDKRWHKRAFTWQDRDDLAQAVFSDYEYPSENGSLVVGWNL